MPSFFYHLAFDLRPPAVCDGADSLKLSSDQASSKRIPTPEKLNEAKNTGSLIQIQPVKMKDDPAFRAANVVSLSESISPRGDWRYDRIEVQNIDMVPAATGSKRSSRAEPATQIADGIVTEYEGLATKGRFEPLNHDEEDIGWGVIRLFRDAEETPGLYDDTNVSKSKGGRGSLKRGDGEELRFRDEDCNTLCILAVPSYLTPSDFLGFVGDKTRDEVSHFRMIRTEKGNRYMVLMKFRNGKKAREWRKEWNGKPFDGMEASTKASRWTSEETDKLVTA